MKTYIFYTLEGLTESPTNLPVENAQLLGQASGENINQALKTLLQNNDWIVKSGFNESKILGKELLDDTLRTNIKKIINYLWADEERHYEENTSDDHIFLVLKELKKLIS